uniref:Uncharacterized protein n=1 Tax=Romanomermis culicivorax TaxID=13658 RepID=A0A915KT80_ROMCU
MVMSDEMKQTNFNLVVNDPFSAYSPPKTWPIYEMKFDHQIAEMPALMPLYSVPNHNEWMNAIQGTMLLNLSYSQYKLDSNREQDVREKAALVKTSSMRDISQMEDKDNNNSKMIPPGIIPTRYRIPKKQEVETSTPVSTDSTTPVLEIKKDQLCDKHGEPIRDIRAYQFSLFRR